jgi:hypothetical protein
MLPSPSSAKLTRPHSPASVDEGDERGHEQAWAGNVAASLLLAEAAGGHKEGGGHRRPPLPVRRPSIVPATSMPPRNPKPSTRFNQLAPLHWNTKKSNPEWIFWDSNPAYV